jgi:hypothetical protein
MLTRTTGKRKTVDVKELVELTNYRNKHSTCEPATRAGWNSFLEEILHATGRYGGFGYYTANDLPAGVLPGMVWDSENNRATAFPDETRRYYYVRS